MSAQLKDTFVDSGVALALESTDHQVLYGRRGTGKTHALNYLAATRIDEGDIGVCIDLRILGSAQGLFDSNRASPLDRTCRLLVNLMTEVHDTLLDAVINDDELIEGATIANRLDFLLNSLRNTVVGLADVESAAETERVQSKKGALNAKLGLSSASVAATGEVAADTRDKKSESTEAKLDRASTSARSRARCASWHHHYTPTACGCCWTNGAVSPLTCSPILVSSSSAA